MRKALLFAGMLYCLGAGSALATDVINQDRTAYKIMVQGEGKLSISSHEVRAGGSLYGLCGYAFCTFEIPGSKVSATKDDKLTIRGGKFVK